MKSSNEYSILLSAVGSLDPGLLKAIAASVSQVFYYPTRTKSLMDDFSFAFDRLRSQFHSTAILHELARAAPREAIRVLAIVDVDLFIPISHSMNARASSSNKRDLRHWRRLGA